MLHGWFQRYRPYGDVPVDGDAVPEGASEDATPEEGKDKSAKGSDDKGKALPADKNKTAKSSDDKGKSTNKETKKK